MKASKTLQRAQGLTHAAMAVAMAGDDRPFAIRSRKGASRRCGSFCEPSDAICAVRCLSAGLRKRCFNCSM